MFLKSWYKWKVNEKQITCILWSNLIVINSNWKREFNGCWDYQDDQLSEFDEKW